MFDLLTKYGMLDYHYWMWITAMLFVVTVVRDMTAGRGIPAGCVARPSDMPNILAPRALPSGRRASAFMPRSTVTGH